MKGGGAEMIKKLKSSFLPLIAAKIKPCRHQHHVKKVFKKIIDAHVYIFFVIGINEKKALII